MSRTLAIVHAPGVNQAQLNMLVEKLRDFMNHIDLNGTDIQVNPDPLFRSEKFGNKDKIITLIVGWGLIEKPRWTKWAYEIKTSQVIKLFIAVDLYERPD